MNMLRELLEQIAILEAHKPNDLRYVARVNGGYYTPGGVVPLPTEATRMTVTQVISANVGQWVSLDYAVRCDLEALNRARETLVEDRA